MINIRQVLFEPGLATGMLHMHNDFTTQTMFGQEVRLDKKLTDNRLAAFLSKT